MKSRIAASALVLVFSAALAHAQLISAPASERESLKGLKAVSVILIGPSPEAEREGLTSESIRADVESQLRRAGVPVRTTFKEIALPEPSLYVVIDTWRGSGFYAFALRVQLQQLLNSLVTGKLVFGSTWERGGVVTVGAKNLGDIRSMLTDYVDQFINDFRAANPATRQ